MRHGGPTRFATATAIAAARGAASAADADHTILVDGVDVDAWADAFPAALAASRAVAPIVLANRDILPDSTVTYFAGGAATPLVCGTSASASTCQSARIALQGDGRDR